MFDFSKYNLQELQAMSDLLDYLREDAGADSLSYFCGCSLLQAIKHESLRLSRSILMSLEEQAAQAERPNAPELTVLVIPRKPLKLEPQDLRKFEELYNDHAAAEAEKVDCIKQACIAGAPPAEEPEPAPDMFGWVGDALDGLHV